MFALASSTVLALALLSSAHSMDHMRHARAAMSRRATPPPGWAFGYLEDYNTYHDRYMAIGCENKHSSPFFDFCCHPMLSTETVEKNRNACCAVNATVACPGTSPSTSAVTVVPTSTATVAKSSTAAVAKSSTAAVAKASTAALATSSAASSAGDDGEDCDDGGDDSGSAEDGNDGDLEDCDDGSGSDASSSTHEVSSTSSPQTTSSTTHATTTHTSSKDTTTSTHTTTQATQPVQAVAPDPSTTSTKPAAPTTTHQVAPTTTTTKSTPTTTPTPTPTPTTTTASNPTSTGQVFTGGHGTWFTQNGVAGACGTVHKDSDLIVALDTAMYKNGDNCGRKIQITNLANGQTVDATVADECPTCDNNTSVDMSEAVFTKLAALSVGLININWAFVDN